MSRTTTERKTKTDSPAPATPASAEDAEVLTLADAAAYLRVTEEDVLHSIVGQGLPGRLLGSGEWRFLKSALQDWLRTPPPLPSKEAVLSRVGSLKNDPHLEEMLREIYRARGRPMTEDPE
jgi:hypothetical protein